MSRVAFGAASSAAPRSSATRLANFGQRRVKVAKICVRDAGLLHELLGISDPAALVRSLKSGGAWVGFAPHLAAPMRIAREDFRSMRSTWSTWSTAGERRDRLADRVEAVPTAALMA